MPAYRGWTNAWLHEPAGLPVPVREDAPLIDDPATDEKGYRIVRTEEAVFAAHPDAAHFRYPYLYGPYQPVPREWSVVRRILDGRQRIVVADEGLTLHHHCYTENCGAAVVLAIEHPQRSAGTIFNIGDEEVLTIRQMVELCAIELGADLELVSMPYDLAVPARPLLAQPMPTHRVLDLTRVRTQLGHHDAVPPRQAVAPHGAVAGRTPTGTGRSRGADPHRPVRLRRGGRAHGLPGSPPAAPSVVPEFAVAPGWGLAYSGPEGRPRTHAEFAE